MTAIPLAITACLLIWVSIAVGERIMVTLSAFVLFILGTLATIFLWQVIGLHRNKSRFARKISISIGLLCLAVFISVPIAHWPLRLAFKLSRPSFDQIASSVQKGSTFSQPFRVGLFRIKRAEIHKYNRKICLWTDLDPAGKTGFARVPPHDVPFNLWSMIELDEDWQFVSED
jgi:hypothetical protein